MEGSGSGANGDGAPENVRYDASPDWAQQAVRSAVEGGRKKIDVGESHYIDYMPCTARDRGPILALQRLEDDSLNGEVDGVLFYVEDREGGPVIPGVTKDAGTTRILHVISGAQILRALEMSDDKPQMIEAYVLPTIQSVEVTLQAISEAHAALQQAWAHRHT